MFNYRKIILSMLSCAIICSTCGCSNSVSITTTTELKHEMEIEDNSNSAEEETTESEESESHITLEELETKSEEIIHNYKEALLNSASKEFYIEMLRDIDEYNKEVKFYNDNCRKSWLDDYAYEIKYHISDGELHLMDIEGIRCDCKGYFS